MGYYGLYGLHYRSTKTVTLMAVGATEVTGATSGDEDESGTGTGTGKKQGWHYTTQAMGF